MVIGHWGSSVPIERRNKDSCLPEYKSLQDFCILIRLLIPFPLQRIFSPQVGKPYQPGTFSYIY